MKTPRFLMMMLATAAFAACAGTQTLAAPKNDQEDVIKIAKEVNGDSMTGAEWKDVKTQKNLLAKKILKLVPEDKLSAKDIDAFLKNPENRMLLDRWYFVDTFGNAIPKAMASKEKKVLLQVLSSEEWMNGFLYSGRLDNAGQFLSLFMKIAELDKTMPTNPVLRKIAVATAGEFSRNNWASDPKRVLRRYRFFSKSWNERLLNDLFGELDFWDMRIVCGWKGDNGWGDETSLRWSRDNVKQPETGYASHGGEIHQLNYRLFNKAGDTVQGADYYRAYQPIFTEKSGVNHAAMAYEVGAVCGGISHYGATGAIGNGIPALTMGEPGHCAFAVRVNGTWRDNNSISWKRGCHWTQSGQHEWAFLIAMQDAFGDQKKCLAAMQRVALARCLFQSGNANAAGTLFFQAIETQPNNFLVWLEAFKFFKAGKRAGDKKIWQKLHDLALDGFVQKYSHCAAVCMQKYIYPQLVPALESDKEKLALMVNFWKRAESHGPATWQMEEFWDAQKSLCGNAANFNADVKAALKGKGDFLPIFENWAAGNPRKTD